jgi:hypothetical protein
MTDMDEVKRLLELQSGVISRRQLLAHDATPAGIERGLRRRELVRILPGVFLEHAGEPTWIQHAWAMVLHYEPAALTGQSALRAVAGPGWRRHSDDGPIHIAVDVSRTVRRVSGCRLDRMTSLKENVLWNASPPRVRPEVAGILVASATEGELGRIGVLADLCQSRRTSADRLVAALDSRSRVRGRDWLRAVLLDIRDGTCSVLEHGYLTRVERPHGLPVGIRQEGSATAQGVVLRDVLYREYDRYVELDGRLFHDTAGQRDADLDRDLDAAVTGQGTVRLGWGQVFDRPCRTTERLAVLLRMGGWCGSPVRCGPDCTI